MPRSLTSTVATLSLLIAQVLCFSNPVYIISNVETASLDQHGLTPIGTYRAVKCIPPIFKDKNIGKIITCLPDKDSGLCSETVDTATPLAKYLELELDTQCGAGEDSNDECIGDVMKTFAKTSDKAIVIVWDLQGMDDLFENIDADYPDVEDEDGDDDDEGGDDDSVATNFDLITTVNHNIITSVVSQNCTGLDGPTKGTYRRHNLSRRARTAIKVGGMSHLKMVRKRKLLF